MSTCDPLNCDDATVLTECPHQNSHFHVHSPGGPDMMRGRYLPTGSKPAHRFWSRDVRCWTVQRTHILAQPQRVSGMRGTTQLSSALASRFAAAAPDNGPTQRPWGVGKRGSMLVPSSDCHADLHIATTSTRTQLSPSRCLPASGWKGSAIAPRRPERRRTTSFLRSAKGLP